MTKDNLLTAKNMAQQLGVSEGMVKKAITELKLTPDAKKGVCAYYGAAAMTKIKSAIKPS